MKNNLYMIDNQIITPPHTHNHYATHSPTHATNGNYTSVCEQISETVPFGKERNSNLELYRIIVMLLIVAHHYVVNSGLMSVMKEYPLHIQSIFLYLFGMWGKTGINCFVMITGYFMCKSNICLRKFMKLLLEVYFYNIVITGIFFLTGYAHPSFSTIFYALVPIQSFGVNFVACFMVFYLLIPFLNLLIQTMDSKLHLRLVALCLLVYSVIGTIPKITLGVNYVSWFVVLYFIASYIRLYGFSIKLSHRNWGWLTLLSILISMASVVFMAWLSTIFVGKDVPVFWFVADSNHIMAVLTALCSFMFFKDLKIGYSKLINVVGASTLGVLLIHANSNTMRQWLWQDLLDNVGQYRSSNLYMHSVLSVITIFVVCILVDMLRMRLFAVRKWMKL